MDLAELVRAMWTATSNPRGAHDDRLRALLRKHALPFVPFGDGDTKTASPGTYRPVGASCPATCRYLNNGCYAQSGNVAMAQRRATLGRDAALHSAAAAMVWAQRSGRIARLHVSGDLGVEVDPDYVSGLCTIAREVRAVSGADVVAWGYSHHPDGPWRMTLADAGIVVRLSDHAGPDGAIVVGTRDDARAVREETGAKVAVCPAQLSDVTCAECRLCWTRPDLTIAFLAHGSGARKVREIVTGGAR